METINDIFNNLAKYPSILANVILEEGNQINQTIKDNITNLNIFPLEYSEYIPEIITSFIITFCLLTLTGFIILYKNNNTKANAPAKTDAPKTNNANTNNAPKINNANNILMYKINKGLYLESVAELNTVSKNLVKKLEKGQTYWVLIRVQMRDYLNMAGTKFEVHGNNIHKETSNTKEAFQTKDAYLILKFRILGDIKEDSRIGYQIIHFMNELNHSKYITNDFIICAIGTSPKVDPNEFNTGLKYIGYEMENNIEVIKKTGRTNILVNYKLLLPVHQVYDVFMDVYNNCLFESTKYVIDNNNYESWNGKSINELAF
jgi:hypothetical protein